MHNRVCFYDIGEGCRPLCPNSSCTVSVHEFTVMAHEAPVFNAETSHDMSCRRALHACNPWQVTLLTSSQSRTLLHSLCFAKHPQQERACKWIHMVVATRTKPSAACCALSTRVGAYCYKLCRKRRLCATTCAMLGARCPRLRTRAQQGAFLTNEPAAKGKR